MPAFDDNARLATNVDVTADGNGADVSTALGSPMQGVPGGRAQQALIWFDGTITSVTALTVSIQEKIGTAYRTIGIANFTTTGLDILTEFGSNARTYTQCVFQVSYDATHLRYVISNYATGGTANNMNIAVVPFSGSGKPWADPV